MEKDRGIARPKPAHHLVTDGQRFLRSLQGEEHAPFAREGQRDPLEKDRGIALPKPAHHFAIDGQRFLRSVQDEECRPFAREGRCDPLEKDRGIALPKPAHYLVVDGQRFLRSVQSEECRPFARKGRCDPLEKDRGIALPKPAHRFVMDDQRFLRSVQSEECRPFARKGRCDPLEKGRDIAPPETAHHIVIDGQFFLRSVQGAEREPFVHEGRCDPSEKGRGIALPETAHHLVIDGQFFLRPVQGAERAPFVHEGRRDPFEKGRDLALPETAHHLVIDGQRFLRSVQGEECGPFVPEGHRDPSEKGRGLALPETAHRFVIDGQRFFRSVQGAEHQPFAHEGRRDPFEKGRGLALPETAHHLVTDGQRFFIDDQRFFRAVQGTEHRPFAHEGHRDPFEKGRDLALPETAHHLVVDGQFFLQSVLGAEHQPFAHESHRDPFEKSRDLALPETAHHLVVDGQRFLRPVQGAEREPFAPEGRRDPFEKGRGIALPETARHLVVDGQRFLRSVLTRQPDCLDDPRPRRRLGVLVRLPVELARPTAAWPQAGRRRFRHLREGSDPIKDVREALGNAREQLFAIPGLGQQLDQARKRAAMQRPHLRVEASRLVGDADPDVHQLARRVVRRHEEDEGFDQAARPAVAAQQVVDVVQALAQVVLLAAGAAACGLNDAAIDEAGELGAAFARIEPRPGCDLLRERRLPQIGEGEIDPPLLGRERFEMTLEVLRMVIDQIEQVGHEIAEGPPRAETGHDREQSRAAAGEDFQRTNRLARGTPAGRRFPQNGAFFRVERAQGERPEQVVQGMVRVVDLVEAAGRAREQDDPRLGLKDFSQPPSRVRIRHVPEHHVQVLDHQHEPLAFPVREVQQSAETPIAERPVVADGAQVFEGAAQVGAALPPRRLVGQAGQAFQPELPGGGNLVALLREDDGEEGGRQPGIPAHFRRDPQEQARLSAAARADDDLVRVRASGAFAEHLHDRLELAHPHAKRCHQLVVVEEAGVVLPGGGHGHRPALRAGPAPAPPYRTRHQSSSRPETKR